MFLDQSVHDERHLGANRAAQYSIEQSHMMMLR
jgi:hypothetical protein